MSATDQRLTLADADRTIRSTLEGSDHVEVGAEVEWLVFDAADPARPVSASETASVAEPAVLSAGGSVTVEPGGQLELSTATFDRPAPLIQAIDADARTLVVRFRAAGLVLVPLGLDPLRPPRQTLEATRYVAMEQYFRRRTPIGVQMMASTAALQLSVDPGPSPLRTWRVLSAAAPILSAVFANSGDAQTGSARQRIWAQTDPARTAAVPAHDPSAWVDAVLAAEVMLRASGDGGVRAATEGCSFGGWLSRPDDGPTADDLAVHLSTMFPPIRPRGHLEVRVIDAVPATGREAAIAVVWTLATDPGIGDELVAEIGDVGACWARSLAAGMNDPAVSATGRWLLESVARSLAESDPSLSSACRRWATRDRVDAPRLARDIVDAAEPG